MTSPTPITHFVSAANSRYFPLVIQWATSVADALHAVGVNNPIFGPALSIPAQVTVLNLGLRDFEVGALTAIPGVRVTAPLGRANSGFADDLGADAPFSPSMIGFLDRCRLPALLGAGPNDGVVWMDADTYVHEAEAVQDFYHLVSHGRAFVVPEIDRAYATNAHHLEVSAGWASGNYTKFFGPEVAAVLCRLPMINSGVVGAPASHVLWDAWESATRFALGHNAGRPDFGIDQVALNFAAYTGVRAGLTTLDSSYNWCVTHATPVADGSGRLCHPEWPHAPLKIVHLLDNLKWNRVGVARVNRDLGQAPRGGDAAHLDFQSFGQHRRRPA